MVAQNLKVAGGGGTDATLVAAVLMGVAYHHSGTYPFFLWSRPHSHNTARIISGGAPSYRGGLSG